VIGSRVGSGRGRLRPALVFALAAILVAGAVTLVAVDRRVSRPPVVVANPEAAPPVDSLSHGVRHVRAVAAPYRLILDTIAPDRDTGVRVLFFRGRPASPTLDSLGGVFALDGAGGILYIDPRLHARRVPVQVDGRQLSSVAAAPDGGLWLVTGDGEVLRVDDQGLLVAYGPGPFEYSLVASDSRGAAWLVRSPEQFAFSRAFGSIPLLARLDAEGDLAMTLGSGLIPRDSLLAGVVNSGHIAVADSVIYFAPFLRDEVVAFGAMGDTLWVTSRGLALAEDEPRLQMQEGDGSLDYAPVNLGIALGPDGNVYVSSMAGSTTSESRLDVLDPATGHLLRSARVPTLVPTLAADAEGRVYQLDDDRILTGVPRAERETFNAFDLETLDGDRLSSSDLLGKVVLINFWASWCAPCRVEMPALDSLNESIHDDDFVFITMNEDVRRGDAASFVREYGFEFPVLLGRGELKGRYHYVGLPFTVLLDREGKVIKQWVGFAGDDQIQRIRALVVSELRGGH
jgi:thiol-disulfide isomerase/thioredoxin